MRITDIKITKLKDKKIKGIASVVFDNEFCVHEINILEGKNGLFITMPNKKVPNGEFQDYVHPINTETREKIQKAIIEEYKEM